MHQCDACGTMCDCDGDDLHQPQMDDCVHLTDGCEVGMDPDLFDDQEGHRCEECGVLCFCESEECEHAGVECEPDRDEYDCDDDGGEVEFGPEFAVDLDQEEPS